MRCPQEGTTAQQWPLQSGSLSLSHLCNTEHVLDLFHGFLVLLVELQVGNKAKIEWFPVANVLSGLPPSFSSAIISQT